MNCPCEKCDTRRTYAKCFDIHIWGDDCPYECEEYENWKAKTENVDEGKE